jgi:uncharacterized membrane protein YgcG
MPPGRTRSRLSGDSPVRIHLRSGSVAFVGLLLAASTGCHTFQPSTPLTVQVHDAETHAPVPGATVRLWRFGPHADERDQGITAGADGVAQAHLAPPDEGGVMVEVSAPGYLSAQTALPQDVTNALASAKPFHPYKGPPLVVMTEMFAGPRPVVELVVPVGYRGMVKAEIRAQADGPWPPGQRAFTYTVPAGGVVRVDGPAVFGNTAVPEVIAKYADGTPLPKDAKNGEVAFRWVRRDGNDIYFAVGTAGDADAVRRTLGNISDSAPPSRSGDKQGGGGGRGGGGGGGRRGGGGGMGGGGMGGGGMGGMSR